MEEAQNLLGPGVSLLTRGAGFFEISKAWLKSLGFGKSLGPQAVEKNLVLGLKKNGFKFNLNPKENNFFKNVCVLSSEKALLRVPEGSKLVLGPNLSAAALKRLEARELPIKFFLAPSEEVRFTYEYYGIPKEKIVVWPVGIDTEKFRDARQEPKIYDCLLYFKRRNSKELQEVKALLNSLKQTFKIVTYGSYKQEDLLQAAKDCRYGAILDGTESQGIAVENLMACNLPLFVWDQIYLGSKTEKFINENLRVTSVPYWDERCGVKVATDSFGLSKNQYKLIPQTAEEFKEFLNYLDKFSPRQFILENLNLEKQARAFMDIFKKL